MERPPPTPEEARITAEAEACAPHLCTTGRTLRALRTGDPAARASAEQAWLAALAAHPEEAAALSALAARVRGQP